MSSDITQKKQLEILQEIDNTELLLKILRRLLLGNLYQGKEVIVIFESFENNIFDFTYEFSSVETASIVTGITETAIHSLCRKGGNHKFRNYSFIYKEDFRDPVVSDVKPNYERHINKNSPNK